MTLVREKVFAQENLIPTNTVKTTEVVNQKVVTPQTYHRKVAIYRTYQIIWYILGVIETLLAFRVILRLIAANPLNPFAAFIYDLSHPFAYLFFGLVNNPTAPNGFIFEWSTIIGMLVYAAVAYGLVYLFQLIKPASTQEVESAVDEV